MPYFNFSKAFDLVLHNLLLRILNVSPLLTGYTNGRHSYSTKRVLPFCYFGVISAPYEVLSGLPQRWVSGPYILTFSLSSCVVCSGIQTANCLLMTATFFVKLIFFMTDCIHHNVNKIRVMSLCRKNCCSVSITKCVNHLSVTLRESKNWDFLLTPYCIFT
jgi:hypothetical protein